MALFANTDDRSTHLIICQNDMISQVWTMATVIVLVRHLIQDLVISFS